MYWIRQGKEYTSILVASELMVKINMFIASRESVLL